MKLYFSRFVLFLSLLVILPKIVLAKNCVTKEFSTDMEMFAHAYENARFLGWGILNHKRDDRVGVQKLSQFLEFYGNEENLKYIFIEYPHGAQEFLARLSVTNSYDVDEFKAVLPMNADDVISGLVTEFTEIFNNIFPIVRFHNRTRSEKLIIVPINFSPSSGDNVRSSSWDRENLIRQEFEKYYHAMAQSQKAIILFHSYHLTRNVVGITKKYGNPTNASPLNITGPVSWMGQTNLLSVDEYKQIVFDTGYFGSKSKFPRDFLFSDILGRNVHGQMSSDTLASNCLGNIYSFKQARDVSFPGSVSDFFDYVYRSENH